MSKQMLRMFTILLIGVCMITGVTTTVSAAKNVSSTPKTTNTANNVPNTLKTQKTANTIPGNQKAAAINPTSPLKIAKQVVKEADYITGVKNATAYVSGKIIVIGLELKENLTQQTAAKTEKDVLTKVKSTNPGYTIGFTTDKTTVATIKTVSQGIAKGKPLSSFKSERKNISTKLIYKVN